MWLATRSSSLNRKCLVLFFTTCSAPVNKDAFVRKCRKLVQSEEEVEIKEEWEFLTEEEMREANWSEHPRRNQRLSRHIFLSCITMLTCSGTSSTVLHILSHRGRGLQERRSIVKERKVSRGPRDSDLFASLCKKFYNRAQPAYQDYTLRQEDYVLVLHQGKGTQEDCCWK